MLTNDDVAERLGCSPSTVSRLRSGDRTPSVEMILEIENRLRWNGQKQLDALRGGTYAIEFENLIMTLE